MPDLELIGTPGSNFVWTCRIAAGEKQVPHTLTSARPHSPEVDAIHPLGKVPAMRHGAVTLFESKAICAYIDRMFEGPALVPVDPVEAARTEQWISLINTSLDPVCMRQFLREYFSPTGPDGKPDGAKIDDALPKMAGQFAIMDKAVAGTGFLVGGAFTLADIYFLPILHYMSTVPESAALLTETTHLGSYLNRHMERQTVKGTTPPPRQIPARG